MNRHTEARLLEFCASQHRRFSAQAWVAFPEKNGCFLPPTPSTHPPPPPANLGGGAAFLANTGWFGHRQELLAIAETLSPGSTGKFTNLAAATRFDCPRFSGMLRACLAHDAQSPQPSLP
ncbi:hypothetical protein [Geminisphaera colitermitum]|uniref:hypothetical protein n=1 Tax=Geminisphaera colitermitum TaxID=1148786 RepID=UPI0005BC84C8|nr:hypothetical protein [Geminisphaera colitermitum]